MAKIIVCSVTTQLVKISFISSSIELNNSFIYKKFLFFFRKHKSWYYIYKKYDLMCVNPMAELA